jgi:hypothetical protein
MPTSLDPKIYMHKYIGRNNSQHGALPASLIGILGICLLGFFLSACSATPLTVSPVATATPPPPSLVSAVTSVTLPSLVVAEREASISGNLPLLAALWAEDGRIVDGRGSADTSDDYVWQGRAAILDRYRLAVFPAPPPHLALSDLTGATLTVSGDSATLINGGDHWRFTLRDGRWWLQELVYSSPAQ